MTEIGPGLRREATAFTSLREKIELMVAMLGSPAAALLLVGGGFSAAHGGCVINSTMPIHLAAAAALLLAAYSGWLAFRFWKRAGREWDADVPGPRGRARLMAGVGLLTAILSITLIVSIWAVTAFLLPCQGT